MSDGFLPVLAGHAEGTDVAPPTTPRNVPYRDGTPNPSADALRAQFGDAVQRVDVVWNETTVFVDRARVREIVHWLHDDPSQQYDYLSDVTAVEYRDLDRPIEVVWHLRSLPYRRFLRAQGAARRRASRSSCRASGTSTRAPIGWSASATTCSASASTDIRICAAS